MRRNPEDDLLPHCIGCDGRHLNSETCEQFGKRLEEKNRKADETFRRIFGFPPVIRQNAGSLGTSHSAADDRPTFNK